MKNKLLLFVSNIWGMNTGKGGHYYTVADHYSFFSRFMHVQIVCVGHEVPVAFKNLTNVKFIPYKEIWDFPVAIKKVRSLLSCSNCVGNAFDSSSFLFARLAGQKNKMPLYFTKCGGAVRKGYTPAIHPDVVFHGEDLEHYKRAGAPAAGRSLSLIPNRVAADATVMDKPDQLSLYPNGSINILRIARICGKYKESIFQSLSLARSLKSAGFNVSLAVVGYPEDERLTAEIEKQIQGLGRLYTSEEVTTNASRHIKEADIVVASGRGVMESALSGKVIMVASKGSELPALLTSKTFFDAMHNNFSDRYKAHNDNEKVDEIRLILNDADRLKIYLQEMAFLAQQYFSISAVADKYFMLYSSNVAAPIIYSRGDILIHLWKFLSGYLVRRIRP